MSEPTKSRSSPGSPRHDAHGEKKKAKKTRKKKGRRVPDRSGPEGAPNRHPGKDDFDPHAHGAEYPEVDRDAIDPHAGSN